MLNLLMIRDMQIKIEPKSILFSFQMDRRQRVWWETALEKGIGVEGKAREETRRLKSRVSKLEQGGENGGKHADNSEEWQQQTRVGEKAGKLDVESHSSKRSFQWRQTGRQVPVS